MNTSMSWIKAYIPDLDVTPEEYTDAMTLTGTKVEGYKKLDACLDKIVVGEVLTCEEHPNSDHLHICTVGVGQEEPLQIVCGAPNVRAGQKVPDTWPARTAAEAPTAEWRLKAGSSAEWSHLA